MERHAPASGDATRIPLGDRFVVNAARPLPELDSPGATAYEARLADGADAGYFALVCPPLHRPRTGIIPALMRMNRPPLLAPVAHEVIDWPETGERRAAIAFRAPRGPRLVERGENGLAPWSEDRVANQLLRPLLPFFREAAARMVTHRAIRLDNLYFADSARDSVILGECVSGIPGRDQPAIYETINGAMADPLGRGGGAPSDDLYALGVVMIALLLGREPLVGVSTREIIERKIAVGSYGALADHSRIPLSMMEPLRGLLCDAASARWGVENLANWLSGQYLTPKQPMLPARAARAFRFDETDHWNARTLALAMSENWSEAIAVLAEGNIEQWIRRSLNAESQADIVAKTLHGAGLTHSDRATADSSLARVLIALDPPAPIRYRDVAARIDGLPYLLAANFHDPEKRQQIVETIERRLPQHWMMAQERTRPEFAPLKKLYEQANSHLAKAKPGFGPERLLYDLNPGWPCLSPLLAKDCVGNPEELLHAFERKARDNQLQTSPIDAHVAAFCAAQLRPAPDQALIELADPPGSPLYRLGVLRLLADVQRNCRRGAAPALAAWLVDYLKPTIERYHNRRYRSQLLAAMTEAAGRGQLRDLLVLLDNPAARGQDAIGFRNARARYFQLAQEIAWLKGGGLTEPANVHRASGQGAVVASAMLSGLGLLLFSLTTLG